MPRCCVPDCDSGSFKEVKRTKAAGLRLKSHFTFPKVNIIIVLMNILSIKYSQKSLHIMKFFFTE